MGELFARAFGQQALLDAWDRVRDAALADGQPDAAVTAFEVDAAVRISEMAEALAAGEWRASPVRRVEIAKPSGGVRRLGIPVLADRIVERALLAVLDPVIDPLLLPWSFAYRRGLGVGDAVAAVTEARDAGAGWVARSDVQDCFERIPQWEVMRRLKETVADDRVVHLVGALLDRPVTGARQEIDDRGRGLHQGSVLSPLLSNLYLDGFDRAMLAAGWRVVRYGDDFAIPVQSRRAGESALQAAAVELETLGLEINSGKSHVASFEDGVRFLGETITASTLAAREMLSHPVETVVYVEHQGAVVRVRGDRLVVTDGEESLLRLNLRRVRQVVCFGRVTVTTPFLHRAADRGIDVVLLSEQGTLGGRFVSAQTTDPGARRAQYRAADNPARSRELAARFVAGKIANMRVSLLRIARRADDLDAAVSAERLEKVYGQVREVASLDELLGVEGSASREYMSGLRRLVDPEWDFAGRRRRPPPDPVNAMLSYGYVLLCHEASAALEAAGLDPAVGFLHQHRWGRPSLALDAMEEFRPITVDVAVWRCLSTRQVRPEQFTTRPDTGCRMGEDAKHRFLAAYERRMLTLVSHPGTGRRVSLRVALHLQAKTLAATLLDPKHEYVPMRWK